jgi:hypothetical protein
MMATTLYRPVGLVRWPCAGEFNRKGKNAEQQFTVLALSRDSSRMDFVLEMATNRKAVSLERLVLGTTGLLKSLVLLQNLNRRLPPA